MACSEAQMGDRTCACVWRVPLPLTCPAPWDRMVPEFRKQPLGSDHRMRIPTLTPAGVYLESCLVTVPQFPRKGTLPALALKLCCKVNVCKSYLFVSGIEQV